MLKRLSLLLGLVGAILLLAAQSVSADAPVTGRAGRAEVRFMEGMIDHHQMALDMAGHCLPKAVTEAVRALCQNVIDAQTPEIELMRGWLSAWYGIDYAPVPMSRLMEWMGSGASSGMGMGHGDQSGDRHAPDDGYDGRF